MFLLPQLTIAVLIGSAFQIAAGQNRCTNPNGKLGTCIDVHQCPPLLELIKKQPLATADRDFLVRSTCGSSIGTNVFICCTTDTGMTRPNTGGGITFTSGGGTSTGTGTGTGTTGGQVKLPVPPECGIPSLADRIYSGNDTNVDEYIWMALLFYREANGKISHNCAGSLINKRYVLTAGHCVKGEITTKVGDLTMVRLGDYDLRTEVDCVDGYCNQQPVDMGIEEIIPHPEYNPSNRHRYHDIALIRLDRNVVYTTFIQPVCLPLPTTRLSAIQTNERLTVAGWGRTLLPQNSNVKQHLQIPVFDHDQCTRQFAERSTRINLRESQLCVGGEFIRDSCDGDSGGPLMRDVSNRWYLEGVVSFGNRCGLENWPGIYTRVSDYIGWIQQSMRP